MSFWTRNILEFKLVRVLIVIGVIVFAVIYIIDYNSIEKRCQRRIAKAVPFLSSSSSNRLQELNLNTIKNQLIEECIKNKGVQ